MDPTQYEQDSPFPGESELTCITKRSEMPVVLMKCHKYFRFSTFTFSEIINSFKWINGNFILRGKGSGTHTLREDAGEELSHTIDYIDFLLENVVGIQLNLS